MSDWHVNVRAQGSLVSVHNLRNCLDHHSNILYETVSVSVLNVLILVIPGERWAMWMHGVALSTELYVAMTTENQMVKLKIMLITCVRCVFSVLI